MSDLNARIKQACKAAAARVIETAKYAGAKFEYHPDTELEGFSGVIEKELRKALDGHELHAGYGRQARQKAIYEWAQRTFGKHAADKLERAMRFLEEALEVAQSAGVPELIAGRLVQRAYSRPPGGIELEIGQASLTLAALAENLGLSADALEADAFTIATNKPEGYFEKRSKAKQDSGYENIRGEPTDMLILCPNCSHKHVDKGEWAQRPHRSHLCEHCGLIWRISDYPTRGVDKIMTQGKKDGTFNREALC